MGKNIQLNNRVEKKKLLLEEAVLDAKLKISENTSVYGTPVDYCALNTYRGRPLTPIRQRDNFQDKSLTVRTMQGIDQVRAKSRQLYETNPNARGAITGLRAFVIGNGYTVKAVSKKPKKYEGLVEDVDNFLNDFQEVNKMWEWWSEGFSRSQVHGEMFLRFFPQQNGVPLIRAIEPDFIRPPMTMNSEGVWSFGIKTSERDTQTPLAYNILYPSVGSDIEQTEEVISSDFVKHFKANVNLNIKRGLPTLFPCFEDFDGVARLRYVATEGEKVRQSIAYVQQFSNSTEDVVQSLVSDKTTDNYTRTNSKGVERTVDVEQVEPGQIISIPDNLEFKSPPNSQDAEAAATAIKNQLEACATRLVVPLWMVMGSDDGSSYASALEQSSPFVKRCAYLQTQQTRFWQSVFKHAIAMATEGLGEPGLLPTDVLDKIDIVVVAPSVRVRNQKDEAEVAKLLFDNQLLSRQTWSIKSDLDFKAEQEKRDEEEEMFDEPVEEPMKQPGEEPTDEPVEEVEPLNAMDDPEPVTASGERNKDTGEAK